MVVTVLTVLCIFATRHFLLTNATRLEHGYVQEAMERVLKNLHADRNHLDSMVLDWASWDDTYSYMENQDPDYLESNLTADILRDLRVHFLLFIRPDASLEIGIMADDSNPTNRQINLQSNPLARHGVELSPDRGVSGFFLHQGIPYLMASRPVLTSQHAGPPNGWVVMGYRLNQEFLDLLEERAGATFELRPIATLARTPLEGGMISRLMETSATEIHDYSPEQMYGFHVLRDVNNQPILLLSITYPRNLLRQEQLNVRFISLWFLLAGTAILAFTFWSLERYVLIPLSRSIEQIGQGVDDVAAARSLALRLKSDHGGVEFQALTNGINRMLQALEAAEMAARDHREQLIRMDKLAALGTLVSGIAHEINNPNTIIGSNAMVLAELYESIKPVLDSWNRDHADFKLGVRPYPEVGPEIPELLREMSQASVRIADRIHELKAFSAPSDTALTHPVNLNDVVQSALTMLRAEIPKRTHRWELELQDSLPTMLGNPSRLEQVVINLVHNALYAVQHPDRKVRVSTRHDTGQTTITLMVEDEGCGIAPDQIKHLGEPFFTTRRAQGGTGLGLFVTTNIINEHKGSIRFESRPQQGTRVTVTFPRITGDPA